MLLVVLGSTGRIGRLVVDEAVRLGWDVRAAIRAGTAQQRRPRVHPWPTDLEDPAAIDGLVSNADAVIGALGPRRNTADQVELFRDSARRLVGSMERRRVGRLVLLSGAGVDVTGDQRGLFDRLMVRIVGTATRHVVAAKQAERDVVAASDLAWTALRPPFVVDGARTGTWQLAEGAPGLGARITRADAAAALVAQVTDERWIGRSPFLWTPRGRQAAEREAPSLR
jgi:putative NADH-flavin reductase